MKPAVNALVLAMSGILPVGAADGTKMTFAGLRKEQERFDIATNLATSE